MELGQKSGNIALPALTTWPLVLEAFHLPKQLRQPRDVDGDPARLVLCHFRACSLTSKGPAKKF
jgi:hypothetical protein